MFTNQHVPYLAPRYQAAYIMAARDRGDTAPLLERVEAARRGDKAARVAVGLYVRTQQARTLPAGKTGVGFLPLAAMAAPAMSSAAKSLLSNYVKAKQGDPVAAAKYSATVNAAKQGDKKARGAVSEVLNKVRARKAKRAAVDRTTDTLTED